MTDHPFIGVYVAHYDAPTQFSRTFSRKDDAPEALAHAQRMAQTYGAIRGNVAVEIRTFDGDGAETLIESVPTHPGETERGHIRLTWFDPPSAKDGPLGPNARKVGGYHYGLWNRQGQRLMGGTTAPGLDRALDYVRGLAAERGMDDPEIEVLDTRPAAEIEASGFDAAARGVVWYANPFESGSVQSKQWDDGHTRWRRANPPA